MNSARSQIFQKKLMKRAENDFPQTRFPPVPIPPVPLRKKTVGTTGVVIKHNPRIAPVPVCLGTTAERAGTGGNGRTTSRWHTFAKQGREKGKIWSRLTPLCGVLSWLSHTHTGGTTGPPSYRCRACGCSCCAGQEGLGKCVGAQH